MLNISINTMKTYNKTDKLLYKICLKWIDFHAPRGYFTYMRSEKTRRNIQYLFISYAIKFFGLLYIRDNASPAIKICKNYILFRIYLGFRCILKREIRLNWSLVQNKHIFLRYYQLEHELVTIKASLWYKSKQL